MDRSRPESSAVTKQSRRKSLAGIPSVTPGCLEIARLPARADSGTLPKAKGRLRPQNESARGAQGHASRSTSGEMREGLV